MKFDYLLSFLYDLLEFNDINTNIIVYTLD